MWLSKKHGKKTQKTTTAPTGRCHPYTFITISENLLLAKKHSNKIIHCSYWQQNCWLKLLLKLVCFFQNEFLAGNFILSMGFQMAIDYVYVIYNATIMYFKD